MKGRTEQVTPTIFNCSIRIRVPDAWTTVGASALFLARR
jgi:hypothetical protein